MVDFDERDLLGWAASAGFGAVELDDGGRVPSRAPVMTVARDKVYEYS